VNPGCAHPRWDRRPDEDRGVRCRYQCVVCRAAGWRRFDAPEMSVRSYFDASANDASDLDLRIEERFLRERIEGGLYVPLGTCNGIAIYHPRGERP